MAKTIYISIGNSDDKLTQAEWSSFQLRTDSAIRIFFSTVHGHWYSSPESRWQNACWCIEVDPENVEHLRAVLADLACQFKQDSIAWAECPETEFIG